MVAYCGPECQRVDWRNHRAECRKLGVSGNSSSCDPQTSRKWGIYSCGQQWQTTVNPFDSCEVEVTARRRRTRSCIRLRARARSDGKKSVHWKKGWLSEQEVQVARLCRMLYPEETVADALQRLQRLSNQGDQEALEMRNDVYRLAQGLLLKGINYIYRIKRTLLEHLAANEPGVSPSGAVLGVETFEEMDDSTSTVPSPRRPNTEVVCGSGTNEMETETKGLTAPVSPSTPPKGIASSEDRKGKDGREVKAMKANKPVLMDCKPMPGGRKRRHETARTPIQLSNPKTKKARQFFAHKPISSGRVEDFKLCSSESKLNFPAVKLLRA